MEVSKRTGQNMLKMRLFIKKRIINSLQRILRRNKFNGFGWDWYSFKLNVGLWWLELKTKRLRYKYCSKGYHKLVFGEISYKKDKHQLQKITFLECSICKYKLFTSKKDREKYKKINRGHNDMMQEVIEKMCKRGVEHDRIQSNEKIKRT